MPLARWVYQQSCAWVRVALRCISTINLVCLEPSELFGHEKRCSSYLNDGSHLRSPVLHFSLVHTRLCLPQCVVYMNLFLIFLLAVSGRVLFTPQEMPLEFDCSGFGLRSLKS